MGQGTARCTNRSRREEIHLRRRKAVALLVYTVLAARPLTREFIATLPWPEHDRSHGLASLRQCLMELQHTLGADLLELDGDHVSPTAEGQVWTDVGAFRSAINRTNDPNRWMQAAELYTGEFLEGFTLAGSAEFDNWQTVETEVLRSEYVDLLQRIIKTLEDRGDHDWAISWAQTLLRTDSLCETAQRSLVRCLEATGERRAALEQYSRCAENGSLRG